MQALDGFDCQEKILKVSFGTTKYCSHFLKGYQCLNQECFYLHQYDHKNEVLNKETKIVFAEQNQSAFEIVCDEIDQVVQRALAQQKQKPSLVGFPSLMELLDYMVQTNWIGESDLKFLIAKFTPKQPKISQKKVKALGKTVVSSQNSIKQNSLASKMTKTTLLSAAIPVLKTQPFPQTHKHNQKTQQKTLKSSQKYPQKTNKQQQIIKNPQIKTESNENQIQDLIQKALLKQISKENDKSKSKMQFHVDHKIGQYEKIRKIIKKFMIIL